MFHKEHSTNAFNGKKFKDTPIRKSDRKNLRQCVASSLHGLNESDGQQAAHLLDSVFLQGSLVSRSVILPDSRAKLYYRSNGDEKDSIWPYTGMQCVWIEANDWSVPSLALLSTLPPSALPTVVVPSAVSKFLCRGANLMRAGVIRISPDVDFGSNAVVVCVSGNPQPFAVGILNYTPDFWSNRKGIAVSVISAYGDDLWKQQLPTGTSASGSGAVVSPTGGAPYDDGDYGNVGFLNGKLVSPIVDVQENDEREDAEDYGVELAAEGEVTELSDPVLDPVADTSVDGVSALSSTEGLHALGPSAQQDEKEATKSLELSNSPDETLHRAVCRALVKLKNSDFPLTVSTFYAQYALPNRDPGSTIELKQTKWKKFSVYLKEQVDRGLVTVAADAAKKDPMAKLTGYDKKHGDLIPFFAEKKANPVAMDATMKKLVLVDLYCIPKHFESLLRLDADAVAAANATSEERKGTGKLTLKEIRQILDQYITREMLVKPMNPNIVMLDGPLTDALYKKKKGTETPRDSLSRKELADLWLARMDSAYALVEMPDNRILRMARGKPPTVMLEVSRRQSNKFITRVRGLEHYGIDPASFSKEVAARFACAAGIEDETLKAIEVLVQGNLVEELEAFLLGDEKLTSHGGAKDSPYHLPKNAVTVELRKGVPGKKKKK